jgi:uncharacterized paraquat-inducible protein A
VGSYTKTTPETCLSTPYLAQGSNADCKMCQAELKEEAKARQKKSRTTVNAMKDSEAALAWQQKLMG